LPWKFCPSCKDISYTAATHYESWVCPVCGKELKNEPEYDSAQALALRNKHLPENANAKQ